MTEETKHEKFQRLMPQRLERAVYHIDLVGNLSSKNYEFSIEEAHHVRSTLLEAVDRIMRDFRMNLEGEAPDAAPEPVEEPQPPLTEDLPAPVQPELTETLQPPTLYDVKWALDMLKRGEKADAIILLKRALKGEPR